MSKITQVRGLIPDMEPVFGENKDEYLFTDQEIETYLEIAEGNVLRAGAYAIIAVANSEAMISKVIRTQDLQTNGAAVAREMGNAARTLLAEAEAADEAWGDGLVIQDFGSYYGTHAELTEFPWGI